MIIKPISIIAFLLTVLTFALVMAAQFLPLWFVLRVAGGRTEDWFGLWHRYRCSQASCGGLDTFTKIEGGKEFFFVAKVFHTIGALLVLGAFILHLVYICWRQPLVRQIPIYSLCGAGLFGLLATLMVAGRYGRMTDYRGQEVALGSAFYLGLFGALLALLASAFTAWASYRKANYDDDEDTQEIAKDIQHADFDAPD